MTNPTPPPELFKQWEDDILHERDNVDHVLDCAWRNGFQAGADQELEACVEWLVKTVPSWAPHTLDEQLRTARRPKPPSLKEQALEAMSRCDSEMWCEEMEYDLAIIRTALESLPS